MERTALRGRLTWQTAAVTSVTRETASVVTIRWTRQTGRDTGPGSTWTCG
jgi:hypothetical protein